MTNPTIDNVFALLDDWRGFPAYQLERRADIYFALFLPFVLKERFELASEPDLIPEFPLRKGTLEENTERREQNRSVKVDYVAISGVGKKAVYLVELKTDMASLRDEQDRYLQKASEKKFSKLVGGVYELQEAARGEAKRKYKNLINCLEQLKADKLDVKPQVVYVQPTADTEYISFTKFAESIEGRGEIAERFVKSLKEWQKPPA